MKILKQSHSAEKLERGTLWAFWNFRLLQNIKKLEGGTVWRQKKILKKSRTVPNKNQRGDPVVPSGFVSYVKNWVHEKGDPLQ